MVPEKPTLGQRINRVIDSVPALRLLRATFESYQKHDASMLSGAIAFYSILSIAPLGVVLFATVGYLFGQEAVEGSLARELRGAVGWQATQMIVDVVRAARQGSGGKLTTIISLVLLLLASSRLFVNLQSAINRVWDVSFNLKGKPTAVAVTIVRRRAMAFSMVGVLGLSTIALLITRTAMSVVFAYLEKWVDLPGFVPVVEFIASVCLLSLVIAAIFRVLPDARIDLRDALLGGLVTSLLLGLGSLVVSTFIARTASPSAYGAAGTAVFLLLWSYYNAQIFFIGAVFTGVWARERGGGIRLMPLAVRLPTNDAELAAECEQLAERQAEASASGSVELPSEKKETRDADDAAPRVA